jgi:hypothetical protein
MNLARVAATSLFLTAAAFAQNGSPKPSPVELAAKTTLPIVFTHSIDADHAHVGDAITARTIQAVTLANGQVLASGSLVNGHIVATEPFAFDKTPYAKQKQASLAIHFDTVTSKSTTVPLNVYVRAMADPIASWDARKPRPSDEDPDGTLTQIGGELLKPHQGEVITMDEDVVGYSRKGGVYAHLIPASGNSAEGCDGSDTEQSMAIFSASACGLYGFSNTAMQQSGRSGEPSTLVLVSHRNAPEIWKNTTALLEVVPVNQTTASR